MADLLLTAMQNDGALIATANNAKSAYGTSGYFTGTYVANGNFETNTTGWTGNNYTLTRQSSGGASQDTYYMSCVPNTTGAGDVKCDSATLTVGQEYTVAVAMSNGGGFTYELRIQWKNSGGTILSTTTQNCVVNAGWATYYVTGTAPSSTSYATIMVYKSADASAFYIDAVRMTQGSRVASYHDTQASAVSMGTGPNLSSHAEKATWMDSRRGAFATTLSIANTSGLTVEFVMHPQGSTNWNFLGGPWNHNFIALPFTAGTNGVVECQFVPVGDSSGATDGEIRFLSRNTTPTDLGKIDSATISKYQTHHIVCTMADSGSYAGKIWVDGVSSATGTFTSRGTITDATAGDDGKGWEFTGYTEWLGHWAVYDKVLTDAQIKHHAALTRMPGYPLVAYDGDGYYREVRAYSGSSFDKLVKAYTGSGWTP